MASDNSIVISTFYRFQSLPDYRDLQGPLLQVCRAADVRGTILLAAEGINATIAGERAGVNQVLAHLRADPRFSDLATKESFHESIPFGRLKVRLKREIVALKLPDVDPIARTGIQVDAEDWNRLIEQDDVTVIDARNNYEARMGSFPRALDPGTNSFHELPSFLADRLDPARHKRIAMFCTGGIRCEKATALLLDWGFDEVYQLQGGILRYLERIAPAESLWNGECFVFDERVSLDQNLQKGNSIICDDCKMLVADEDEACPHCQSTNLL